MASHNKRVTISAVYQSAGKPSPETLDQIYKSLLEKSYKENMKCNLFRE